MKTIDYNYYVLVIGTIVSMLYWTQLGRAGRRVVRAVERLYRERKETVQGVAFLAGTLLLAWGGTWVYYLLTHPIVP